MFPDKESLNLNQVVIVTSGFTDADEIEHVVAVAERPLTAESMPDASHLRDTNSIYFTKEHDLAFSDEVGFLKMCEKFVNPEVDDSEVSSETKQVFMNCFRTGYFPYVTAVIE